MSLLPNSLGGVALLVAVWSALLAWPLCRLKPAVLRWISAVWCVPLILSYFIYWLPAWFGSAGSDEYSAWEILGVGMPFLAGMVTSALVVLIVGWRRPHRDGNAK